MEEASADRLEKPEMPSGVITFLFTDIEGSTELWQRDAGAMSASLASHDERVRGTIEAHGGYIFGVGGDGFFGAFAEPSAAIVAAEAIQHALVDNDLIKVRIGLHAGEAVARDGAFFGLEVNRTARVATCAHGGQIVLSGSAAGLCPPGTDLVRLGSYQLRGLDEDAELWQLGRDVFPDLRTGRVEGNISVPFNEFIGRDREMAEIQAEVRRNRLVTLLGMGGVGKTRLASQSAAELDREFPDGSWIVYLASVGDGASVVSAVADAIGLPVTQGIEQIDALERWFQRSRALLVIDNCEHVIDAVGDLAERLTGKASGSRLIATSQVSTGVAGESIVTVQPLSGDSEASTELFIARAAAAKPGFVASADDRAAISDLCASLDHLPLAVELAAARVASMTPTEIADRLGERFRLLGSRSRRADDRHKTLEAAVRWSYDLLDEVQQAVFRRMSVFMGAAELTLAEQVVVGDDLDVWDVLDSITDLCERSLVVASVDSDTTRYRMLESVRAFGRIELERAGELEAITEAYTAAIHASALDAANRLIGPDDRAAQDALERDWDHIRAAMGAMAADETSGRFQELYGALAPMWNEHGRSTEGIQWAEMLRGRPTLDPALRARALMVAGCVLNIQRAGAAQEYDDEAFALWREHDTDPPMTPMANQALDAMLNADDERARELVDQVLAFAAADETPTWNRDHAVAVVLSVLGQLDPDLEEFRAIWDREMARAAEIGCEWHQVVVRATMSRNVDKYPDLGDPKPWVSSVVDDLLALGNPHSASHHLSSLAVLDIRSGEMASGVEHQLAAFELMLEHAPGYVAQRCILVAVLIASSSPQDSASLLGFLRKARASRGYTGSTQELQIEAFAEDSIRPALGDEFEAAYAAGERLTVDEAVEVARRGLLGMLAAQQAQSVQ
ncbi:MAG: adenylate/guanylate cyclase domain-containing protein [Actinomycetota bacterium]